MEETKINFFKRVKKAIFNFDEYNIFANEKTSKAFWYIFNCILISVLLISLVTTYKIYQVSKSLADVFINEVVDFKIEDGKLELEDNVKFEYKDDLNSIQILVDTNKENIEDKNYSNIIAFLNDKVYVYTQGEDMQLFYTNIFNENFQKSDIDAILTDSNIKKVNAILFIILFISSFVIYTISILFDVLILSLVGLVLNLFIKTNLKYKNIFNISIYSITLSIILLIVYTIINTLTYFEIPYFNLAYYAISYVYIITVIFMNKSDEIKNTQELFVKEKINENVGNKLDELENEKQKEKKEKKEREENKKEGKPAENNG